MDLGPLPQVDGRDIWLDPISGGTDFAGAFVAGNRALPVVQGEMQCRCLGAAVEAWSDDGRPLIDAVGELVCTKPMPSMPLRFWGDEDNRRYLESYFDMFPGVWRHGDWIRLVPHPEAGATGAVIYGRSDATINRHGIRMGTAELYRAVEVQPEVLDSLVVDLEYLGRESWMALFVVLREGLALDDALTRRLRQAIRQALSARHVPDEILQVAAIPRTLSGKKMELPVKKLLLGAAPEAVLNRDAMANADSIDWFIDFAARRAARAPGTDPPPRRRRQPPRDAPAMATMVAAGTAPDWRCVSRPPSSRTSVGMLRMPKRPDRRRAFVAVDLDQQRTPGQLAAGLLERRRHHPAGAAPRRPEVHQHRQPGGADDGVEVGVAQLDRLPLQQGLAAAPAVRGFVDACRRHAVGGAAMRAGQKQAVGAHEVPCCDPARLPPLRQPPGTTSP